MSDGRREHPDLEDMIGPFEEDLEVSECCECHALFNPDYASQKLCDSCRRAMNDQD